MKGRLQVYFTLVATGLATTTMTAHAQVRTSLEVGVSVDSLWRSGVSRVLGVQVAVAASSTQQLLSFYLDAPVPIVVDTSSIDAAGTLGHWMVMDRFADRRVTSWTNARRPIPAGESTPRFVVRGEGVFGVVRYWTAFHQEPIEPDSMPVEMPDSLPTTDTTVRTNGPSGWTVGIVAPPPAETASAAADRLRDSITSLCALGWVSPGGVCTSLRAKVASQSQKLDALANELAAQRGKHVNEGAYWILLDALDHIRKSLQP